MYISKQNKRQQANKGPPLKEISALVVNRIITIITQALHF